MFQGFNTSILIITALLVVLPALMLYAAGGSEWLERLQLMMPGL
ncbi:hypothetical protein [Roseovarius sp. SYSU LYC5161]